MPDIQNRYERDFSTCLKESSSLIEHNLILLFCRFSRFDLLPVIESIDVPASIVQDHRVYAVSQFIIESHSLLITGPGTEI